MLKLGSHVGMNGKEMLLGSAKEAVSYGANTFMFYTGAPQNTRRKEISELNIEPAWKYMKEHGIDEIVVHAPYIINLGNSVKPETFSLAVEFLAKEINRTIACRSHKFSLLRLTAVLPLKQWPERDQKSDGILKNLPGFMMELSRMIN